MSVNRLACLSLLTIAAAIQSAHAESHTPLQPVDVVATRYDARAACPGIEAQLQAALGRVAWLEGREALVEVQFAINGEHERALDARGGDYDLRMATRQAIGQLRDELADAVHVWPFDGWAPPPGKVVIAEVYPSIFRNRYPREGRSGDEQDAYATARWMADMAARGALAA